MKGIATAVPSLAASPRREGIASLILGVLSFLIGCLPLGIVGVVLGVRTLNKNRHASQISGIRGLAIAGICLGIGSAGTMMAIVYAAQQAALSEARRIRSSANLKAIAEMAMVFSADEHPRRDRTQPGLHISPIRQGIVHPQSEAGELDWIGLGGWDWGGCDGTDPHYNGSTTTADFPWTHRASGRPLLPKKPNGDPIGQQEKATIFEAPTDQGHIQGTNIDAGHGPDTFRSLFKDKGTSYQGNVLWLDSTDTLQIASEHSGTVRAKESERATNTHATHSTTRSYFPDRAYRFCTFMRPTNMMPDPGETVLFYEGRFIQAFMQSEEYLGGGAVPGTPMDIPGWYGKIGEFNVSFADGHVSRVRVRKSGDVYSPNSFDVQKYPYRNVMARGPGWRIDCFPEKLIVEHVVDNP